MAIRSARRGRVSAAAWWSYLPLVILLAMRLGSEATVALAYLGLAAYALIGRGHAIRALALCWLFTMLNPAIAPDGGGASAGRYAVILFAAASVFFHGTVLTGDTSIRRFTLYTILLGLFIVGHSLLLSPIPDVSILKAVSWTLTMATLVSAWSGLPPHVRETVSRQLFRGLVAVLVLSLPLLATSAGYTRNESGFQGILNHPQAFGLTMALLCVWTTTRLFGETQPPWWLLGVAGASFFAILLAETRTAGVAVVLGAGLSLLLAPGFAGRSITRMAPGLLSGRVWAILIIIAVAGLVMAPFIADRMQNFVTKSGRADVSGFMAAYEQSRGSLMDRMLANIVKHPLTGIGFGISSDPGSMVVDRDPLFGLPTGAAIEKGVVPIAVTEELGIIGAALVACWIWMLLRGGARSGLAPFAVCLTALLLNMGEATFFSPGGFGMLPLILFGWAYASGERPKRRRRDG